jgi:hypothetical protein
MKINRDNYEAYFLDYHEGQLSPEMAEEVMVFVGMNPDLRSVFNEFESITLVDDQNIVFENKSFLKKNQVFATSQVNDSNYEEFLISETEGLLNTEQLAALEEFISINPQFEKDRRLYALAHLPAENDLVFESKESLKQKAIAVGSIDEGTFETYFARELEDDLDAGEQLQLAEFMQYNPHLEKDRRLYKETILTAGTDIVFENKNLLKQAITPMRRIVYYALSAAASLALVMSIYFLLDRNDIPKNIAEQGKPGNSIEQQIKEPANIVPDNQVAANAQQETEIPSDQGNTSSKSNNTPLQSDVDVKIIDSEKDLAVADRQSIEPIQARAARKITTRQFVDPQFTFIRKSQMYQNEQIEFYYNLKLAEQVQYAQLNTKDKNPAKTIMNAATGKAADLFANRSNSQSREEKKNVSLWTFAELGVQTFNSVTSSDLELNLRKDEEGKVVAYGIQSGLIDFEKEVKK